MLKFVIALIFLLININLISHPVHITVTNIEPNVSKACFEVSIKIFTDDLEAAIAQELKSNIGLIANNPLKNISEIFLQYIDKHFAIIINNKKIPLSKIKFIKYTIVENATWLYFEYKISNKIQQLSIYNDLLNHLYPDMTNLVIINWNNYEQGLTFTKSKTTITI